MGTPFMSEIKIVSFNFAPQGWAFCNGQLLPIAQNQALFSLMGTTYGGDGRVNFGLPDLRGRVPIHWGAGFTLGEKGGEESHTVSLAELPTHVHFATGTSNVGTTPVCAPANVLAKSPAKPYGPAAGATLTTLHPASVTSVGGSQPHTNLQPYLVLNYVVALQGAFPTLD